MTRALSALSKTARSGLGHRAPTWLPIGFRGRPDTSVWVTRSACDSPAILQSLRAGLRGLAALQPDSNTLFPPHRPDRDSLAHCRGLGGRLISRINSGGSWVPQAATMAEQYDLVTLGAGSGGTRASRWSAQQYGVKVAVVEMPFDLISSDEKGGAGGT